MDIIVSLFFLIVLLFSVIIHEIAHGSMALYLGDPTAKYAGRLTLNPLKHLDPFGSVLLPLFLFVTTAGRYVFGWAKPVPVNPYNFRDQKWGELKVSLAGPATNLLIGMFFSLMIRFFTLPESLLTFFSIISVYNFALAIFNLVPIPPLDGYHALSSLLPLQSSIEEFLTRNSFILLIIFIFLNGIGLVFLGADFLYAVISGA